MDPFVIFVGETVLSLLSPCSMEVIVYCNISTHRLLNDVTMAGS